MQFTRYNKIKSSDEKTNFRQKPLLRWDHYETARLQYEKTMEQQKRQLGEESADVGKTLLALGTVNIFQYQPYEAKECAQQALAIFVNQFGEESEEVACAYNLLGIIAYISDANTTESIRFIQKAVERSKNELNSFIFKMNLEIVQINIQSPNHEALRTYYDMMENAEKLFGKNNVVTASLELFIGSIEIMLGENLNAEKSYLNGVQTLKNIGKSFSPIMAGAYNELASLCFKSNRMDEAEKYFKDSLIILENSLGKIHPMYRSVLSSYGYMCLYIGLQSQQVGDINTANENYTIAMDMFRQCLYKKYEFPEYKRNNMMVFTRTAAVYSLQRNYEAALEQLLLSYEIALNIDQDGKWIDQIKGIMKTAYVDSGKNLDTFDSWLEEQVLKFENECGDAGTPNRKAA